MSKIFLKCVDGTEGYFTHIAVNSTNREVCIHTSPNKAYKFSDRTTAFNTANYLKKNFKCILYYNIV